MIFLLRCKKDLLFIEKNGDFERWRFFQHDVGLTVASQISGTARLLTPVNRPRYLPALTSSSRDINNRRHYSLIAKHT